MKGLGRRRGRASPACFFWRRLFSYVSRWRGGGMAGVQREWWGLLNESWDGDRWKSPLGLGCARSVTSRPAVTCPHSVSIVFWVASRGMQARCMASLCWWRYLLSGRQLLGRSGHSAEQQLMAALHKFRTRHHSFHFPNVVEGWVGPPTPFRAAVGISSTFFFSEPYTQQ